MSFSDDFEEIAALAGRRRPLQAGADDASCFLGRGSVPPPVRSIPVPPPRALGTPRAPFPGSGSSRGRGYRGDPKRRRFIATDFTSTSELLPYPDVPSPPSEDLERLAVGDLVIPPTDAAFFYGRLFDLAAHMITLSRDIHAEWSGQVGVDSDTGPFTVIRVERDRLHVDFWYQAAIFRERKAYVGRLEALAAFLSVDIGDAKGDSEIVRKRCEDLETQIAAVEGELQGIQGQADSARTDLAVARAQKAAFEGKLATLPGKAAALSRHGYQRAVDHSRLVYPSLSFPAETFCHDHEIVDGQLVRFHANGPGSDVLFPRPR